jgi:nicotinamide-nucleotide amidase
MLVVQSRMVFASDRPESLAREVLAAGNELDEVRLEVDLVFPEVHVGVLALEHVPRSRARAAVKRGFQDLSRRLAANLVSRYGFSLPEALVSSLSRRKHLLAVGESCTGGLVGHEITSVPGASATLGLGVVAYKNEMKTSLLGVRPLTLERHGAVSRQVARQMLDGLLRVSAADCALVTTGIAGPSGGTPDKPVGTVYLGACAAGRRRVVKRRFSGRGRPAFKRLAAFGAMKLLLDLVRSEDQK